MLTRIAVASLWAENVPHNAHFYRDVIGLPLMSYYGEWPHFKLGDSYLVILKGRPMLPQDAPQRASPLSRFLSMIWRPR